MNENSVDCGQSNQCMSFVVSFCLLCFILKAETHAHAELHEQKPDFHGVRWPTGQAFPFWCLLFVMLHPSAAAVTETDGEIPPSTGR